MCGENHGTLGGRTGGADMSSHWVHCNVSGTGKSIYVNLANAVSMVREVNKTRISYIIGAEIVDAIYVEDTPEEILERAENPPWG
jgi:hypothetical protein